MLGQASGERREPGPASPLTSVFHLDERVRMAPASRDRAQRGSEGRQVMGARSRGQDGSCLPVPEAGP